MVLGLSFTPYCYVMQFPIITTHVVMLEVSVTVDGTVWYYTGVKNSFISSIE